MVLFQAFKNFYLPKLCLLFYFDSSQGTDQTFPENQDLEDDLNRLVTPVLRDGDSLICLFSPGHLYLFTVMNGTISISIALCLFKFLL